MKLLLKSLQFIYSIYCILLFVVLMLVVLPFVIAGSLFGSKKGGNFIYKVLKAWGFVWYLLIGVRHRNIYEVPHDKNRPYIFVANHVSFMDIPPIVVSMNQPVRVLGKYEMVNYPVFGYIYKCAVILVDRKDAERRAQSVREMKAALQKHISIFIFPEGTFNETGAPLKEFYDGAFRIAIETQTSIKPILLLDTLDRLHYRSIFSLSPGPSRVVFMDEVPVAHLQMEDLPVLKEKVYKIMEKGLLRYRGQTELEAYV